MSTSTTGYSTFFERVKEAGHPISPAMYFEPYENNLLRILNDFDVTAYDQNDIYKYETTPEVITDVGKQMLYEENKHKGRAKSEGQITNDVMLWHFVQDQRKDDLTIPLEAKYWVVTVDYRFLVYDRYKTSKTSKPPVCMLPAQFIQILRFFAPRSEKFEKMMLGSLRFPLVSRDFDTKAEQITLRILGQLARYEGIGDIAVETIDKILADDVVRSRLNEDSRISDFEVAKAVENSLATQITEYEGFISGQKGEISQLKDMLADLISERQEETLHKEEEVRRAKEEQRKRQEENDVLRKAIDELSHRVSSYDTEKAQASSISHFIWLSALLVFPYPILLALLWRFALSNIIDPWLAYSIAIGITLLVAIFVVRVLIAQGKKDEYIAKSELFMAASSKLRSTTIISLILSAIWLVTGGFIVEILVKWLLP